MTAHHDSTDLSMLSWCAGEIRQALETAEEHLVRQLAGDSEDSSLFEVARGALHQAHGALGMVDLPGVTQLSGEAETILGRIDDGELELSADVISKLSAAFTAINEYLDELMRGEAQQPLRLYPYLKDLLQLRKAERIHPADLFFPELIRLPAPETAPAELGADESGALRSQFETGLLGALRSPGDQASLGRMAQAVERLSSSTLASSNQTFWMVANAYFRALQNGQLELDAYGKRLLARINMQIRRSLQGGSPVADRLLRDTLFSVARGDSQASELQGIFDAFELTGSVPSDFEQARYRSVDRKALADASDALTAMKKTWEAMLAQPGGVSEHLGFFKQSLSHFRDAADELSVAGLDNIIGGWLSVAKELGTDSGPVGDAVGVEVAMSLLFVEQLLTFGLKDFDDLAGRADEMTQRIETTLQGGTVDEEAPKWLRALTSAVQERLTIAAFTAETQAGLRESESILDNYFRDPEQGREALASAQGNLAQISGVMKLLGHEHAAAAAASLAAQTGEMIDGVKLDPQALPAMAGSVGTLGFFLDAVKSSNGLLESFVFDPATGVFEQVVMPVSSPPQSAPVEAARPEPISNVNERADDSASAETDQDSAETVLGRHLAKLDTALCDWAQEPNDKQHALTVSELLQNVCDGAQLTDAAELLENAQSSLEIVNAAPEDAAVAIASRLGRPASLCDHGLEPVAAAALPEAEEDVDEELLEIFLAEATEVLETIDESHGVLEQTPTDQITLTTVRRAFHTLKGSSRMVGLDAFGDAGWALEQVLNTWLAEEKRADDDLLRLIRQAGEVFSQWVASLEPGSTRTQRPDPTLLVARAEAIRAGESFDSVAEPVASVTPVAAGTPETEAEQVDAALPELVEASEASEASEEAFAVDAIANVEDAVAEIPEALESPVLMETALPDITAFAVDDLPAETGAAMPEVGLDDGMSFGGAELSPDGAAFSPLPEMGAGPSSADIAAGYPPASEVEDLTSTDLSFDEISFDDFETATPESRAEDESTPTISDAEVSDLDAGDLPATGDEMLDIEAFEAEPFVPEAVDEVEALNLTGLGDHLAGSGEAESLVDIEGLEVSESEPELESVPESDSTADIAAAPVHLFGDKIAAEEPVDVSTDEAAPVAAKSDDDIVRIGEVEVSAPLFGVFCDEARQLEKIVVPDAQAWLADPARGATELARRAMHSLKGSAALVQVEPVRALASALEQFLAIQISCSMQAPLKDVETYHRLVQVTFAALIEFTQRKSPDACSAEIAEAGKLQENWKEFIRQSGAVVDSKPSAADTPESGDDSVPTIQDEFDEELLPLFIEEAEEYLPLIDENLRAWLKTPGDTQLQQLIMRQFHTVKGSARMAGAMVLGQRVHDMETNVEAAMSMDAVPTALIEELLAEQDIVSEQFEFIRDPSLKPPASTAPQAPAVKSDSVAPAPAAEAPTAAQQVTPAAQDSTRTQTANPLVRVRSELLDKLVNEAGEVSIARSRLDNSIGGLRNAMNELAENVSRLRSHVRELEMQGEMRIQASNGEAKEVAEDFDPLEFDRFTRFQELTRMMAESVNDVGTFQSNATRAIDEAMTDLNRQGQTVRQLQHNLMGIRMVQFGTVSDRLYRVVRQVAKQLGKRVSLDIRGATVQLDRGVLEKMVAPLEHLLRNAISHGIESPEVRVAAGKPETGDIRLEVMQDGNETMITLSDDGGGLDLTKIRERAIERELIAATDNPADARLADMIFMPGFSTARSVDQISGRGVGMDVVRSEVSLLGGRVQVSFAPENGTQFMMHLPLTMAIEQVMMVTVGDRYYAVPSASVEQVLQLDPERLAGAYAERSVLWQDEKIPLYNCGSLVHVEQQQIAAQHISPVIVLRSAGRRIAVHADEVGKSQEVVVKNVGVQVAKVPGIAGATLMGNGDVVLILHLAQLADQLSDSDQEAAMRAGLAAGMAEVPATVMVVDDSVTVRKVTQRFLAREGFDVILAKDGVDALRQLEERLPDVMLVDVEMPRMDGFDLTRALRKASRLKHLPVVMITSRTADKHRNFAMSLGVNEYLGKPYDESRLLELINMYVARQKEDQKAAQTH